MAYDIETSAVEPMVDGMIDLLKVNLIANTFLIQDAHVGDKVLYVDNSFRFNKFDWILLLDNKSSQEQISGDLSGVEFHKIIKHFQGTNVLYLNEPLNKDFLVNDNARIQKTIKKAILYEKDILYGDRQVINCDFVAICVEPDSKSQDWLATRLLGTETNLSIMIYVKCGGLGEEEEYAMRVCNAYADATNKLLLGNIHLDMSLDEVPLVRDAHVGDTGVYIDCDVVSEWIPGIACLDYEVQDTHGANQLLTIVDPDAIAYTSSSSSSSSLSSTAKEATSSSSWSSSSFTLSESSISSGESSSSVSSESWSSQSIFIEESSSKTSESSLSSSISSLSSVGGNACWVELNGPLRRNFLVADKAVLRRKKRYTYDSRISSITYGTTQKGSVFMKAAKLQWFGKEAESFNFPQVGTGRPITENNFRN
jgi:hypothetical protein